MARVKISQSFSPIHFLEFTENGTEYSGIVGWTQMKTANATKTGSDEKEFRAYFRVGSGEPPDGDELLCLLPNHVSLMRQLGQLDPDHEGGAVIAVQRTGTYVNPYGGRDGVTYDVFKLNGDDAKGAGDHNVKTRAWLKDVIELRVERLAELEKKVTKRRR